MSKKSARKQKYAQRQAEIDAAIAAKRAAAPAQPAVFEVAYVERPFAGMANELELIAMRDLLPAATLRLRAAGPDGKGGKGAKGDAAGKEVVFATVLPNQVQGLVRSDGVVMVALQTRSRTRNAAHDLAVVLTQLLEAEPGTVIDGLDLRREAPALEQLLEAGPGEFQIHRDFGFWLTAEEASASDAKDAIERSAEELVPCAAIGEQRGAYWTRMNKDFVRWIWDADPDRLFDALARLRVAGKCTLGQGSFFIGAFRALGLIVPVWEFPERVEADSIAADLAETKKLIEAALADDSPLSYEERRARAGLVSRQVALT